MMGVDHLSATLQTLCLGKCCQSPLDKLPIGIKKLAITVVPTSKFYSIPCQHIEVLEVLVMKSC
jgi:hypothetical protein